MSTEFINDQWRLPNAWNGSESNVNKQSNYSMEFDGSSDFIDAGSASYLNGLSEFSISVWFNLTTALNDKAIVSDWNYNTSPFGHFGLSTIGASGTNYGLRFYIKETSDGGNNRVDTASILTENNWYNAIFTYNSGTVTCYIDGSSVALTISGTIPTTLTSQDGNLNIGKFGGTLTRYWPGKIDAVSIYNYALSSSQVTTLYGSSSTGIGNPMSLSPKPVAMYNLGDKSAFNNSNYLIPNSSLKDFVFNFGGSTNEKITTSNSSLINGESAASFSLWIKGKTGLASYDGMLCFRSGSDYILIIARGTITSTEFPVWIQHSGGGVTTSTSNAIVSLNEWNHIVVSGAVGGKWNIYVNGELSTTQSQASNNIAAISQASSFIIGQDISSREFVGEMSNVQIFNTALPATGSNSIETLYNNGSPLTSMSGYSSLQGWWKLDASDTYDSSTGNWTIEDHAGSNDGTSSGMTQANLVQSDLSFTSGYSPYALDFDGSNDYIDCGTGLGDSIGDNYAGSLTASLWFKRSSNTLGGLINFTTSGWGEFTVLTYTNFIRFGINATTYPSIQLDYNATNGYTYDTNWHHLAVIMTPNGSVTDIKMYFDGQLLTITPSGTSPTPDQLDFAGKKLYIGTWDGATYSFNGSISNVSIWNTALTSTQVSEIYNEGVPSNLNNHSAYSNLVSWWQLGSNSSFNTNWTVLDEKGSNDGTSANMGEDAIVDGVGSYANGLSSGMGGDEVVGDAPYSTANALSVNMDVLDRVTDTPS